MKVLIIEDEAIIRTGIIKKVNWDKLQVDQVFEADNGENGYETIIKENPEIIILDINIPRLTGIELLSRIRNEGFDSRVVILSGHDNFEYAQQAIKYGVDNYLLKPCSAKQIEDVLFTISTDISIGNQKKRNHEEMKKKLKDMVPFFRSSLINSIITGGISDDTEIVNLARYLEINILNENYIVAVILYENKLSSKIDPEDLLLNKVEICQLIGEIDYLKDVTIDSSMPGKILLLMTGGYAVELKKAFFTVIDDIIEITSEKSSMKLAIGIGNVSRGIENIKDSYNDALISLESRFVESESRVYFIEDIIIYNTSLSNYPYDDEKKFLSCVKSGIKDKSIASLNNLLLFLQLKKDKYPANLIKIHLRQLVYYMIQVVYEFGGDISDLYASSNLLDQIENFSHVNEYQKFLCDFTEKLCEYISKKRYLKYTSTLRKIIIFIEQNYADEDFSLEKVADNIGMHPNYISHLFKKEKGENLASYLSRFRIKKAAELILKSDYSKISDIAYAVGFSDSHYFTTCFKNIIGVTPSEYRKYKE